MHWKLKFLDGLVSMLSLTNLKKDTKIHFCVSKMVYKVGMMKKDKENRIEKLIAQAIYWNEEK